MKEEGEGKIASTFLLLHGTDDMK